MKRLLTAAAVVTVFTVPAFAQFGGGGNIHGTESRGEPYNSSYRASGVDPATGYTPGHTGLTPGARAQSKHYYVKKKKKHSTSGSASGSTHY